ncbi:hypothetical protein E2I00_015968 [Balaenoptera physalus]|uniref:Palmitoyltransferase n=1 Tax=Balaenoptera physalus TaxID=9770 RepID=A0A643BVQ9_BALPH|nr:hypothetical protein E2I00_015968 [Balaenoptera physalus]
MFVWSYWMTIFTSPASPSKEFCLSNSEKERYEKEFSQERQQEILRRAARDLPIYTTSASKTIRYCERCQLIKPDRAHHCSACDMVNNCVGFSNYKFFLLFLLYSLLYCLFVATTVLQYFIKFWTNELSDTRAKFHILFLFFVSTMFFISVLSLLSYHCWLVGKNRTTIVRVMAAVFRLVLWGRIQNKLLFQTTVKIPEGVLLVINIGSNPPFPIKPLSESKNRLLDSEAQWLENGSEEGVIRSGNARHLKTLLCLVKMKITRFNKCGKIKIHYVLF